MKIAKPIPEQLFNKYLKILGLRLKRAALIITFTRGIIFYARSKSCIAKERKEKYLRDSIRKTEKICEKMGLEWPPKKKLRSILK